MSTASKFALTTERIAAVAAMLNHDVKEAFGHRTDQQGKEMLRLLTVDPSKDAIPTICMLQSAFYDSCARGMKDSLRTFGHGRRESARKPCIIAELRIKPSKQYINGTEVGYYQTCVPHALPEKLEVVRGYHQTFGNITVAYIFGDRRQIKIHASTEAEGHRCINQLLGLVDPKQVKGNSENHSVIVHHSKDANKHKLTGLSGTANRIKFEFPDRTHETHQL
jgi:hypothetical protein